MCSPDPATIGMLAGAALSAGGTVMNSRAASQNQARAMEAQNAATMAEFERQRGFQRQADESFAQTLGMTGQQASAQKQQEGKQNREQATEATAPVADFTQAFAGSTPDVVQSMARTAGANRDAESRARASNLAQLQSYGDGSFAQSLGINSGANRMRDIGSMSAGSAALLPLDRAAAGRNAQKAPSMFGDLLGLAGQGLSLAAGTGFGPFAKATPPIRTGSTGRIAGPI